MHRIERDLYRRIRPWPPGAREKLALELWKTGVYEAQLVACYIADPQKLTVAQMNAWTRSFDNWATCDTACFCLFDRSPHAWGRVEAWAASREEFVKRAGYALLAALAAHDKLAGDERFLRMLPLIEQGAGDERNFVWKGVSWGLRRMGLRGPRLLAECTALAERLAASDERAQRWVGKDALRDFAAAGARRAKARAANRSTSARASGSPARAARPRARAR